jgi:hypothetical protein
MVKIGKVGVPLAWLLSNSKTTDNYEAFFKHLCRITDNKLNPKFILCDYEVALREAPTRVWPSVLVFGDSFHFIQCNVKWMKSQRSDLVKDLVINLRILWASPSYEQFVENVNAFTEKWASTNPSYVAYFRKTWMVAYKPVSWAYCGRKDSNVPTGKELHCSC